MVDILLTIPRIIRCFISGMLLGLAFMQFDLNNIGYMQVALAVVAIFISAVFFIVDEEMRSDVDRVFVISVSDLMSMIQKTAEDNALDDKTLETLWVVLDASISNGTARLSIENKHPSLPKNDKNRNDVDGN